MSKLDITITRDIVYVAMSDAEADRPTMDDITKQRLTETISKCHLLERDDAQALLDKTYVRARQSVAWLF